MSKIKIRTKKFGEHQLPLPEQHHYGDAGFDLRTTTVGTLMPGEQRLIPCGYGFEIPNNWVGIVKDRSSIAKRGLHTSAGVIDATYRGQVHIMMQNNSSIPQKIDIGDKIAQMIIIPCMIGECELVEDINETERGEGGFGSSGIK